MRSEQQRTRSLRRRNKGVLEEPGLGRVRLAREWHRIVAWGNLTKFAQTLKKGEHVYVSGELRYREYEKAAGEGKDIVKIPVAEIHAAEIRRLDPPTSEDGMA